MTQCKQQYIDNSPYKKLIRKNNEVLWNNFYDSLLAFDPNLVSYEYEILFTSFALLEAIGLGQIKQSSENQILPPALANESDICGAPAYIYDQAAQFYLNHESLKPIRLIRKINKELRKFSCSKAANSLRTNTLIRWKRYLKKHPKKAIGLIVQALAWETMCGFLYIEMATISDSQRKQLETSGLLVYNAQLSLCIKLRKKYKNLPFFTIVDRMQERSIYYPSYKQSLQNSMCIEKINSIKVESRLKGNQDLMDSEMIHLLCFGVYKIKQRQYIPILAFTCDKKNIIRDRLISCISSLEKFKNDTKIDLNFVPGIVYFMNDNCEIFDSLEVATLLSCKEISITVVHNIKSVSP